MSPKSPGSAVPSPALTAIGLGLLSIAASSVALLAILCAQIVAQRPALQGVMVFHLSKRGELRLWNQPIRPQEVPGLLERVQAQPEAAAPLVVRLVPEAEVPWGVVHAMLQRLRPLTQHRTSILQLQLP
jgi:hypothetical protein